MKKISMAVLAVCMLAVVAGSASALIIPPAWRGAPDTTFQLWTFDTPENPAEPTVVFNDYGDPTASINGDPLYQWWIPEDRGHYGVWKTEGDITMHIPNTPNPNPLKIIVVQMIYDAGVDQTGASVDAWLRVEANNEITTGIAPDISTDLGDGYKYSLWKIFIQPNPTEESVIAIPFYCNLYVDAIAVDTICIPEPATLAMLGLGSAMMFIRRKK